jgi:hypothetical protein
MSPHALAIVQATADQYGVDVGVLFARPWSARTPETQAARVAAMVRLHNEILDGRRRFSIRQLCEWFQISRPRLAHHVSTHPDYVPRHAGTATLKPS